MKVSLSYLLHLSIVSAALAQSASAALGKPPHIPTRGYSYTPHGPKQMNQLLRAEKWNTIKKIVKDDIQTYGIFANAMHEQDKSGRSLLHLAIKHIPKKEHIEGTKLIEFLLKCGANINMQDYRGNTPLHHAIKQGKWQVAKKLLEKGARTDILNDKNRTALDEANKKRVADEMRVRVTLETAERELCPQSFDKI